MASRYFNLETHELETIKGAWVDLMLETPEERHTTGQLFGWDNEQDAHGDTIREWETACVVGLLGWINYAELLGFMPDFDNEEWHYLLAADVLGHQAASDAIVQDNDTALEPADDPVLVIYQPPTTRTFRDLAERVKSGRYDWIAEAGNVGDSYDMYYAHIGGVPLSERPKNKPKLDNYAAVTKSNFTSTVT